MSIRCQDDDPQENLSVPPRNLAGMTNSNFNPDIDFNADPDIAVAGSDVFADPVAYLASFGITAVVVARATMPAAA
jgi:hypothetical protein